jgi:hypothetical protein
MKRRLNILNLRKPEGRKVVKLIAFIFVMIITSLTYPTTTRAGNIVHTRGPEVDADFFSLDPSGCIETDVFLTIADQQVQSPPGPGTSGPAVLFFDINKFNNCTGELLFTASCSPLTTINFQVAKKLDSATLNATLECFEFLSSSSFNISANLTWIATGTPTTERSSSHFFSPGCKTNFQFDGTFTPAQASGTVSDGTTNFTPDPSVFADIASVRSGEVEIGCQ